MGEPVDERPEHSSNDRVPEAKVQVRRRPSIVWLIPLPVPAFWMLGFWIATQLFYVVIGSEEPVAWWAHLGGVVAGALLCIPMRWQGVQLFGGR